MSKRVFVINPGSTSTKIAVYDGEEALFQETIRHSAEELSVFQQISDQEEFRRNCILATLSKHEIPIESLDAVVCRGGLIAPLPGGTFGINEQMIADCEAGVSGHHACNLGAPIGKRIAEEAGIPAFIVDAPVVDEMLPIAKYTGSPLVRRTSIFHALNAKAMGRDYAAQIGRRYEELNLIVCHMGGGITISAHRKGKVIDTTNGATGEGPITPERVGMLPTSEVIRLCFSGEYSQEELEKHMMGTGGLIAYTGSSNVHDLIEQADAGDKAVAEVLEAGVYTIAKAIGSMATVLCGEVDQIILTGGIANNERICEAIKERTDWIAGVSVLPGEDEMLALAKGACRVLDGEEEVQVYAG